MDLESPAKTGMRFRRIPGFVHFLFSEGDIMKKFDLKHTVTRTVIYCVGLLFMALGVALSVNSNLGVSPVNSLPYVISKIVNVSMGNCVIIVFCSYILLQILILRKEFKLINLTQILFSTIFGYFVDFAKWLVGDFVIPTYAGKLLMLAVSIVLIAIGVFLYLEVKLVPMPMEGLSTALAKKTKLPFPTMKTIVDCIVVVTGIVLSFVFLGKLDGIREGTIITALVTGKVIAILKKPLSPMIQKLCFPKE